MCLLVGASLYVFLLVVSMYVKNIVSILCRKKAIQQVSNIDHGRSVGCCCIIGVLGSWSFMCLREFVC